MGIATPSHTPLRAAMEAADHDAIAAALAPDVVLRSPIFSVPFEGREEASELFEVLLEIFDGFTYTADIPGDPHVLGFEVRVNGELLEGVDLLRFNESGEVREITVFMRPLRGLAAFMDAAAPRLGRKRSRGRAAALRLLGPPPSMMMRAVAGLGPRILGLGRKPG